MTFIASGNPADMASQTRDVIACLADFTASRGSAHQMSENGWSGFCLLLLMVETELSKLTGMIESKQPDFEKQE